MRFFFPLILIALAIGLFVVYTNKTYTLMSGLRTENAAYDEALLNSRTLLQVRDDLTQKYNSLSADDRTRLIKLMPDNVDNIRLVIDIQNIAAKYGMQPRDVHFGTSGGPAAQTSPDQLRDASRAYGTFDLDFSVSGTYPNFISFLKDLEHSLRIVDVSSISFGVSDTTAGSYKYNLKIKTYWLRD